MHVHDAGAAGHVLVPHDRRLLWRELTRCAFLAS